MGLCCLGKGLMGSEDQNCLGSLMDFVVRSYRDSLKRVLEVRNCQGSQTMALVVQYCQDNQRMGLEDLSFQGSLMLGPVVPCFLDNQTKDPVVLNLGIQTGLVLCFLGNFQIVPVRDKKDPVLRQNNRLSQVRRPERIR